MCSLGAYCVFSCVEAIAGCWEGWCAKGWEDAGVVAGGVVADADSKVTLRFIPLGKLPCSAAGLVLSA
eukprot:scaffold76165_cov38-Tisochrysis_lutea.AAC.3